MTARNPFNFIDPRTIQFPANKTMICPKEELETSETYFNGTREIRKQRWAYDNYVFGNLPFESRVRRGDRVNIEERMLNIHNEELRKPVPSCTQSWYGHRQPRFNERLIEGLGRVQEMKAMTRRNGLPFPKRNTFGREQIDNKTLIEIIKTKL